MRRIKLPDLSDPTKRLQALLVLGAIAISALFVLAVAMPLASNPTFCGVTCHSQNPEYQSWKKSSHASVTCYACHMDRYSPTHLLQLKLVEAPLGIIHTITNGLEKPINKDSEYSQEHLPSDRCERCHTNENRKFSFSKGIWMNHGAHKAAGLRCTTCHNRIAHKGAEKFEPLKSEWEEAKGFKYKNFLTMKEGCFRCHSSNSTERSEETLKLITNGKTPPQACTTCHTKDFNLPLGHGTAGWRSQHGELASRNFSYCLSCHNSGAKFDNNGKPWCSVCHDDGKVASFKSQVTLVK